MDVAQLSMSMANAQVLQGFQLGMMKKAMEQAEQTGAQLAELMQTVDVATDSVVDIKA